MSNNLIFIFSKYSSILSSKKTETKVIFNQTLNISLVWQSQSPPGSTEERAGPYGTRLLKLLSATVEIQDSIEELQKRGASCHWSPVWSHISVLESAASALLPQTQRFGTFNIIFFFVRNPSQRKWGERLPVPAASGNQHCDGQRFLPERPLWSELQRCCTGHDAVRPSGSSQRPRWFPLRRGLQLHP